MATKKTKESVFRAFTNLYELSKTLRFELKPVGKTLEKMKEHLEYDKDFKTFLKDQKIEDAYQKLKPEIDEIHEYFINNSLGSEQAKGIDFSAYLEIYKKKDDLNDVEKQIRTEIGKTYLKGGEKLKEKYPRLKWKKGSNEAKGYNMLLSPDVLEAVRQKYPKDKKVKEALKTFKGFFTYFSGFNQNRENYYEIGKEASTAIATRIINENLPKFCDNIIQFEGYTRKRKDKNGGIKEIKFYRKDEYLSAYQYLKDNNKTTQIKDAESGKMIEALPITEDIFQIKHFSECLSQKQIEEYNRIIGHYNLLINLYNQAHEKDFKKLPRFKALYKQIGCGKRDPLFFTLTYDTKAEAEKNEKNYPKPYSVEQILEKAEKAGKKYFSESGKQKNDEIETVFDFTSWLRNNDEREGIYWSKQAINTISNKYLANWYDIKEKLKADKTIASFDKKREEQIKINDAAELAGLFAILDEGEKTEGWSKHFFKPSVLEDKEKNIDESKSPSWNLINMLCDDIEQNAKDFTDEKITQKISSLSDYKKEENKKVIKEWMDYALAVYRMIRYFRVKPNKIKGQAISQDITSALEKLLDNKEEEKGKVTADWFKWYDALRNYLTKKPQDDVRENKLKLNFDKGNLLNGFVDSHTKSDNATQYGGYLFRKKDSKNNQYEYFLGISNDAKLFRCHLQDKIEESDESEFERLEYYQPKSTTFFSDKYSLNKIKIVDYLKKKIKKQTNSRKQLIQSKKEIEILQKEEVKTLKGDTPTKLINNIKKSKEYACLLEDRKLVQLIDETIDEMIEFIKNYEERTHELKEIQKKDYKGIFGLEKIIKDLQEIAKEQKIYNFFFISQKEIEDVRNRREKPLYFFKITNKDLSKQIQTKEKENKKIYKNLHTLYFECLLSGKQSTVDIGKGEIFYRKKAIDEKKIKKGYESKPWIIENKRFTENSELEHENQENKVFDGKSFFLHLSVFLNYAKSPNYNLGEFNEDINEVLIEEKNIYFLGLDRGEKHLVYYSLVNQNGEIIKQGSLNIPFVDKNKKPRSIKKEKSTWNKQKQKWETKEVECWDYNDLLDAVSSNRDMARKNWQTIGNIKNLKEGYISQVVHEIVKVVKEKPTYIVLEDLNTGFKRGRQKIEKQVYQKLEVALAKKLNFVVDKNTQNGEIGSVTNALQLTPPMQNYGDIENRKQVGIMFYTRANYTSQTDPVTGWRKTIYLKKGSEQSIKEQIIGGKKEIKPAFTDIGFDGKDYFFEYEDRNTRKKWKLWSGQNGKDLVRYRGKRTEDKNIWETEKMALKKRLDKIFEDFDKDKSFLDQIRDEGMNIKKSDDKFTAWESLRFVIDLIQQIRNSGGENTPEEDDNFLLSPVRNESGNHFDSRKVKEKDGLPIDADANGAFNIARKGILMHAHIGQWIKDGKPMHKKYSDLDLLITDEEWDIYLDDVKKWNKKIQFFSSREKK